MERYHVTAGHRSFIFSRSGGEGRWDWTEQPGYHPLHSASSDREVLDAIAVLAGAEPVCANPDCDGRAVAAFMGRAVCATHYHTFTEPTL